jgi:hypothetical protein
MGSIRPGWEGPSKKVLPRTSQRELRRISRRKWDGYARFLGVVLLLILMTIAYMLGRHDRELRRERPNDEQTDRR